MRFITWKTSPPADNSYRIQRAYHPDGVGVTADVACKGEIVLNIGAVAHHITPDTGRRLQRELFLALAEHDVRHLDMP